MSLVEGLRIEHEGLVAIATVAGELDGERARSLRGTLLEAPRADVVALLLDLSEVSYLDSAGVHLLLDVHQQLARRGYAMHLVRPRRRTPALVLDVTDVASAIDVHADRGAALAAIDPPAT